MASPELIAEVAREFRASRPAVRPRQKADDPDVEAAFAGNHLLFSLLWHIVEAAFAALIAVEVGDHETARECLGRLVAHVRRAAKTWDRMHGPESEQ